MKKIIIFITIIIIIMLVGYTKATLPATDLSGQPKIEITPLSFDFGEIEYGKVVESRFKVKNAGTETLEIKRVATSCGCTQAKVDKEKISPGEEAELKVVYDSGAMSGSHAKGKQERIIYLKSNDPRQPQIEVMIYAEVK